MSKENDAPKTLCRRSGLTHVLRLLFHTQLRKLRPQNLRRSRFSPGSPTAFRGDGQWHLCYEIYINNLSPYSWTVQSIETKSDSGALLSNVAGKDLDGVLFHPSRQPSEKGGSAADIAPGEASIAYMWINLPQSAPMPSHLQHQFTLKKAGDPTDYEVNAPTTVVGSRLPQIVSPLRGSNWVAGNGPSNSSQHRRAMIVIDGDAAFRATLCHRLGAGRKRQPDLSRRFQR